MSPAVENIVLLGAKFSPPQLPGLQAWYDLSDPSYRTTTTALFAGTGTATTTLISAAIVGVGTAFLSELAAGDLYYDNTSVLIGTILSVTDNTNATLTGNAAVAITAAAFKIQKANPRIILIGAKGAHPHLCDLNDYDGNGSCTCGDFSCRCVANMKGPHEYLTDDTLCHHLRKAHLFNLGVQRELVLAGTEPPQ